MRYWAWFAAKITLVAAVFYGILAAMNHNWPPEPRFLSYAPPRFGYSLSYTMAVLMWFLLCCGVLYLCIWDQRYRCRVCVRRLRMPVETGSWSRMLQFGRPRIEYICPFGHGKLNVAELQISGLENPEWTAQQENLWDELCAAVKADSTKRP